MSVRVVTALFALALALLLSPGDGAIARAQTAEPSGTSLSAHTNGEPTTGPHAASNLPRAGGPDIGQPTDLRPTYGAQLRQRSRLTPISASRDGITLTGLVIDETLTRHGREFYTAFHQSWRSPTKQGIYTIVIREQPAPGRGTQVSVWVNDTALYRARLIPGGDVLGDHPVRAVHRTSQYVASGRAALRIF